MARAEDYAESNRQSFILRSSTLPNDVLHCRTCSMISSRASTPAQQQRIQVEQPGALLIMIAKDVISFTITFVSGNILLGAILKVSAYSKNISQSTVNNDRAFIHETLPRFVPMKNLRSFLQNTESVNILGALSPTCHCHFVAFLRLSLMPVCYLDDTGSW